LPERADRGLQFGGGLVRDILQSPGSPVTCTMICGSIRHNSSETPAQTFPSGKVYRRDDRGIVGVEFVGPQGLAFVVIHTVLDVPSCRAVPARARSAHTSPPGVEKTAARIAPGGRSLLGWGWSWRLLDTST